MSQSKSFWRQFPRRSSVIFLLGVFLIFSTIAFVADMMDMGREPTLRFVLSVLITGVFTVFYAVAGFSLRSKWWKACLPIFAVHFALMNAVAHWLPTPPQPEHTGASEIALLNSRLAFDGIATIFAVCLGYVCFVYVSVIESRRYLRVRAEIELAAEIHRVLVPPIETKLGGYEFYGQSLPSGDVGGDLIDLAGSEEHWVAYLADVSGHGVAPGVVMGMVKSAARMLLSSGDDTAHLLPRLNEVLFPLKKPDMFVTFCFIARNAGGLRIGLAGHPAILHFSARSNQITQLECPNMPLGILPSGDFESSEIRAEQGDVFALYTDGFLEQADAAGEEFGLTRFHDEFQKHGKESLEAICRSLQESVARHGTQFDDQSILLIRRLE
jgi:Stage II sporulation protein E (SpoIIE)